MAQKVEDWRISGPSLNRGPESGINQRDNSASSIKRLLTHPVMVALFVIAGIVLTGLSLRRHNQSWKRKIKEDSAASAIAFYQEMLRTLERIGHKREPHQTPAEFAAQLARPQVAELTSLYHRARFGQETLNETEINRISSLLSELKKEKIAKNAK